MALRNKKRWSVQDNESLSRRSIYLLPNKTGIIFIITCVLMIGFGLNYENNLVLFVALSSLSALITSLIYSFFNLRGLSISHKESINNIYAGGSISIPIHLSNINKNHIIRELHLATGQGPDVFIDNTPSSYTAQLNCVCHQRGFYDIPLIKVDSVYPLGLIRAFSYFSIEEKVLVYPKPQSCEYMLQKDLNRSSFDSSRQQVHSTRSHGNDEISGLKNYRPGDAISLIDWKQLAKGKGLMVKDFSADESMDMYLTENSIKSRELEEQISMLTYAVIDLTRRDIQFGFRFREINIQPGNGFEHQQYILRRLALY